MDVLSDVLRTVRMQSAFFFDVTNHAPWVTGTPAVRAIAHRVLPQHEAVLPFKVITEGSCRIELLDGARTSYELVEGDVAVFPRGEEHYMMSAPGMRCDPDPPAYDQPLEGPKLTHFVNGRNNGGPVACRFICGFMGCSVTPFNPLLGSLPPMFKSPMSPANRDWLQQLGLIGVAESEGDNAGRATMLLKLAELMLLELIRQYIKDIGEGASGWLAGLRDRHVGAALSLMHERPAYDWTLETLAQRVGLSRSMFAERFATIVGMPAIQYLARWRLMLAAQMLDDPDVSIPQAGAEVGYASEAAFQRAFKKHVGTSPGAWRKSRAPQGAAPETV